MKLTGHFNQLDTIKILKKDNSIDIDKNLSNHIKDMGMLHNDFIFLIMNDNCPHIIDTTSLYNIVTSCSSFSELTIYCKKCDKNIKPYFRLKNKSTTISKKFISLNSLYNKLQKMLHMTFIQDNIDDIKFKKKYQKEVSNIFVYYYIQNI